MTEAELIARLGKLERDNRRFKSLGAAALALAAALGLIAAARAVPDAIKAREFDMVDQTGKVRVKIAMDCIPNDCWPAVSLFDANGKALTDIGAGTLSVSGEEGTMELLDNDLQIRGGKGGLVNLEVQSRVAPDAELSLSDNGGTDVLLTSYRGGGLDLGGEGGNSVTLHAVPPSVEIADSKGYLMEIGHTELSAPSTGATQKTSAASIVMFDNGKMHHLIWQAP